MTDILKGSQFEVTTAPKIPFYFLGGIAIFLTKIKNKCCAWFLVSLLLWSLQHI